MFLSYYSLLIIWHAVQCFCYHLCVFSIPKFDQNFNVSFPTTACSPTFHKTNMLHNNDFKRMQLMSQFGIKYWTSSPVWVRFQEHGSSFYVNIKGKVWILVKKNTDLKRLTGRLKLRFLTEIGWFHWNQGEKVTHFAWFGEPWNKVTFDTVMMCLSQIDNHFLVYRPVLW